MSEGIPKEEVMSDTETVDEIKNEAESITTDFDSSELPEELKTEAVGELSTEDKEKVEAISGSLKEELEAFEAGNTEKKNEESPALPAKTEEVKKVEEKKKDDKKKKWGFLGTTDRLVGIPFALGASMFKRVGNFYQKMKSFFTGKPAPQAKK
jgi:hypothetical protein